MYQHTKPRYTINDMLNLLSVGRATLYAAINDGSLKTHKIGKHRFACPEDVDAFINRAKQKGSEK